MRARREFFELVPSLVVALAIFLEFGCAARSGEPKAPPTATGANPTPAPSSGTPQAAPAQTPTTSPQPGQPAAEAAPPSGPLTPLPELKIRNVGLHIGGGANDADSKAPFQRAIAAKFPDFMDCYRLVENPGKSGTFGVDLHIPREGGHARVEQPRTRFAGAAFRQCMLQTFERVQFEKPKKGPTVISYSLKFSIGEE